VAFINGACVASCDKTDENKAAEATGPGIAGQGTSTLLPLDAGMPGLSTFNHDEVL